MFTLVRDRNEDHDPLFPVPFPAPVAVPFSSIVTKPLIWLSKLDICSENIPTNQTQSNLKIINQNHMLSIATVLLIEFLELT